MENVIKKCAGSYKLFKCQLSKEVICNVRIE